MTGVNVKISRRKITEEEINLLNNDIRVYPDLIYVGKDRWSKYQTPYVFEENGKFAGVCAIYEFKDWIKVGPFVLLKMFHNKGYGKMIVNQIMNDYPKKDLFIASSNLALKSILKKNGFEETTNFFKLPYKIKLFFIKQFFEHLSFEILCECVRKFFVLKRGNLYYFVKKAKL